MDFAKVCQQQKNQFCFSSGQHRPCHQQLEKTESFLRLPSSCRSSASPALCHPERPFCSRCLQKKRSFGEKNQLWEMGTRLQQGREPSSPHQGSNTPSPKRATIGTSTIPA